MQQVDYQKQRVAPPTAKGSSRNSRRIEGVRCWRTALLVRILQMMLACSCYTTQALFRPLELAERFADFEFAACRRARNRWLYL